MKKTTPKQSDEIRVIENLNDLISIQREQVDGLRVLTTELSKEIEFHGLISKVFFLFLEKNSIQFHEFLEFINEQRINDNDPFVMREILDYVTELHADFESEKKG